MNLFVTALEHPLARWSLQSVAAVSLTCVVALAAGHLFRRSAVAKVWAYGTAMGVCLLTPLVSLMFLGTGQALIGVPVLPSPVVSVAEASAPATALMPIESATVNEDPPTGIVESSPVQEARPLPATPLPAEPPRPPFDLAGVMAAVYIGGLALAAVKLGAGAATVRRVVSRARPVTQEETSRFGRGPAHRTPWPFHRTLVSDQLAAPVVAGALRPVLVLPEGFADEFTPTELDQVLAHEAEHARSCHLLTALVARTTSAVHWFNPLVGLLRARLSRAMEEQCDNASLAHGTREEFARLLVSLAEGSRRTPAPSLAMSVMDPRFPLEQRIRGLFDPERRTTTTMNTTTRIVVLGVSVAGCLLLAGTQMVAAQAQEAPAGTPTETVIVQGAPEGELTVTGQDGRQYVLRPVRQAKRAGKRAARTKARYVLMPIEQPGRATMPPTTYVIAPREVMPVPAGNPVDGRRYRIVTDGSVTVAPSAGAGTAISPSGEVQWVRTPGGTLTVQDPPNGKIPNSEVRWAAAPRGATEALSPQSVTFRRFPAVNAPMTISAPALARYRVTGGAALTPTSSQDPFGDRDREYFQRASEMLDGERSKSGNVQSDPLSKPGVKVRRFRSADPFKSTGSFREMKLATPAFEPAKIRNGQARGLAEVELERFAQAKGALAEQKRLRGLELADGKVRSEARAKVAAGLEVARAAQDKNARARADVAKRLAEVELDQARNAGAKAVEAKRLAEAELAQARNAGARAQGAKRMADDELARAKSQNSRLAEAKILKERELFRAKDAKPAVQSGSRKPYRVIEGATVIIYDDGTTEIRPAPKTKTIKTAKPKAAKAGKPNPGASAGGR